MARIVGALATSHIPAIGGAIAKGLQQEPYWKPFFDGFDPAREWLAKVKPDAVVVFYNDHGLNFFLDKMPTFAVGAAAEYRNDDEGWGIPTLPPFKGSPELSWTIIDHLVDEEFDIVTCQEMLVDHAFTVPLKLFWPDGNAPVGRAGVRQHRPVPAAERQALLRAGQGGRRGDRRLGQGHEGRDDRLGGPEPPARWRARRFHQQAVRPANSSTAWSTIRPGRPSFDPRAGRADGHAGRRTGQLARRAGGGLARRDAQGLLRTTTSRSATRPPPRWCWKRRDAERAVAVSR